MGQVISLSERLARREREQSVPGTRTAAFFFALDCPLSYLVAEQVERDLGEVAWVPILASRDPRWARERLGQARALASLKRLPLQEPDNFGADPRAVARAALLATGQGLGRPFALAAMRLAFAGGYDLASAELVAEAALHAGLCPDAAVQASCTAGLDRELTGAAMSLRRRGIVEPPVIRIASGWFSGFDALSHTSAFMAARSEFSAWGAERA